MPSSASLLRSSLASALLLAAVACSSTGRDDNTPSGGNRCVPGQSAQCFCADGKAGAQTCQADGTFDACSCAGSTPDAGGTTKPDGGTQKTPCAQMCDHVYDDCGKAFVSANGSGNLPKTDCLSVCNSGSVSELQRTCFTAASCEGDALDRCFHPGEPLCPQDKACGTRTCGPDPVCGESCGGCSAAQRCNTSGQCETAHGWVLDVFNSGFAEALSVATDRAGGVHAALLGSDGKLYYAKPGANYVVVQTIGADSFSVAQTISLKIDQNGHPHLAYSDKTTGELRYARDLGSGWAVETVDAHGEYASLALDSQGRPHVAYSGADASAQLKYARRDQSGWHVETVDLSVYSGLFASIAIDSGDHPHVVYDVGYRLVRYAHHDGTAWVTQLVSQDEQPAFTSLALDAAGQPHLAYHSRARNQIRYAHLSANAFTVEDVAPAGSANGFTRLGFADDGTLFLAFMETGASDLKVARRSGSPTWALDSVDTQGNAGMELQLAVSPGGIPWVLYQTNRTGQLTMLAHYLR